MSSATFYKWRAKYGGMDASLMKGLKELEYESSTEEDVCRGAAQSGHRPGSTDKKVV